MSAKPKTSLNARTKHSSSTFMVSVSVPSMSNMTRRMGKRPNYNSTKQSFVYFGFHPGNVRDKRNTWVRPLPEFSFQPNKMMHYQPPLPSIIADVDRGTDFHEIVE